MTSSFRAAVAFVIVILSGHCSFAASAVEDFYKSHSLFMQIGSSPGGIYDVTGRLVARHISKYIPGHPNVVVQDIPGGGSLLLANQFGNTTQHDGSIIGVFNDGMPTTPLTNPQAAHFDATKFIYIGSPTREAHILVVWRNSPIQSYDDIFKKELIVGASSPGAAPYDFPYLTNALIGTKFKIVKGYEGGPSTKLAMSRGEINGEAGLAWGSYKTDFVDEIKSGDVKVLAAFGVSKNPELADVPLLPLGSEEDKQLFQILYARQNYGRLFLMPPGTPSDKTTALRLAFAQTMEDADFRAEAARAFIDLSPVTGDELERLTAGLYATPSAVTQKLRALLGSAN